MAAKKKDPWGAAAPNPFTSTHNAVAAVGPGNGPPGIDWGPILDGTNRRRNIEKGMREGFVQAEDGSWVPRSYYGNNGPGQGIIFEDMPGWDPATMGNGRGTKPIEW